MKIVRKRQSVAALPRTLHSTRVLRITVFPGIRYSPNETKILRRQAPFDRIENAFFHLLLVERRRLAVQPTFNRNRVIANVISVRSLLHNGNNLLFGRSGFFPAFLVSFPTSSTSRVSSNIEKPALCHSSKTRPPRHGYRLKLHDEDRRYFAPIHIV